MKLEKVHEKIQRERLIKDVMRRCEHEVVGRVQANCLASCVQVLHDKFGFGKRRLQTFMVYVYETYDSIRGRWVEFEDLRRCIYDELGIDFEEVEKMLADKRKREKEGNFS